MPLELTITRKQQRFIDCKADEVLFGGAAGGGKSYGQLIDALLYALKYPRSKQLILRRTYPDLERTLIRGALEIYPRDIYTYSSARHVGSFANGSIIDFGYCDAYNDVFRYQGAEYDTVRFDELTHFTREMYLYLISRLRGVNLYPRQIKSSSNPGGIGHNWVKERFIDIGAPDIMHSFENGTRQFIPSLVSDNGFLMKSDPDYAVRLGNLPEKDKRALLYGDWDIFEGQYFTEFDRRVHVIRPFPLPDRWRRYVALDYGLDMLAAYWIAVDLHGRAVVYKELYESGLIISDAAKRIRQMTDEAIYAHIAPPDLWNRRQDTGRSVAEIFADYGIRLTRAGNDRVSGWLDLREWLRPFEGEEGEMTASLRIFDCCVNLIRTLPAIRTDPRNPCDCADTPHELTHAPDALRYFVAGRPRPGGNLPARKIFNFSAERPRAPFGRGEKIKVL